MLDFVKLGRAGTAEKVTPSNFPPTIESVQKPKA